MVSLQWQEVHLKPVVIDGEPQILAFTRNITERKAAEENCAPARRSTAPSSTPRPTR